jgi:hypothetical protein
MKIGFEPIQVVLLRHILLKCLYQARKVSGHVFKSNDFDIWLLNCYESAVYFVFFITHFDHMVSQ